MQHSLHKILPIVMHDFEWWLEIALWVLLACVVWWCYHRVYKYLIARLSRESDDKQLIKAKKLWPMVLLKSIHHPLVIYLWFLFITWLWQHVMYHMLSLQKPLFSHWPMVYQWATVLTLFAIVMGFIHHMQNALLQRVKLTRRIKTSKTTIIASAQLLRMITTVLVILMLLQITGIPVSALLAVGGMGTLAIGFAAKDTLENYMGGAMIFFDRPFGVGDWIKLPAQKIEGTVEQIGWRLTKVRAFNKQPFYVPNKLFSNVIIINPSRMTNRRIKKVIGVRYQDVRVVDAIVQNIQAMLNEHESVDHTVTTFVNLIDLSESALEILVYAFTKTTDWIKFQAIQQTILLEIVKIIQDHGAECAFPTRTLDIPDPVTLMSTELPIQNLQHKG